MQEHQKQHEESKHEQKEEKHEKKEAEPFKIPPIIIQCQNQPAARSNLPMRTRYVNRTATFAGSFEAPFNNDTMRIMGLTQQSILDSVRMTILPSAVMVHHYYNIWFNLFGLRPVVARWRPIKIEVLDPKVQNTFIAQKFFTNCLDREVSYQAEIIFQTSETTTSGWSTELSQSLGVSASAGIEIRIVSAGVTIETTQTTAIGKSQEFSRTVTLGSSSGVTVPVRAFESIRVELNAFLGRTKATVTYEVQLDGYMIAVGSHQGQLQFAHIHSSSFPFTRKATVQQIVEVGSYGSDFIRVLPWVPTNPCP